MQSRVQSLSRVKLDTGAHGHEGHHAHSHDHGDHSHEARADVEQKAVDAEADDVERSRLTKALVKVGPLGQGLCDRKEFDWFGAGQALTNAPLCLPRWNAPAWFYT